MVRPDDITISDDAVLLRALLVPGWWTETELGIRASSVAFNVFGKDGPGQTSCYFDNPVGREIFARRFPNAHAARFTARQARLCGFNVTTDPEGDPDQSPEHAVLTHSTETKRSPYQRRCKELAMLATFVSLEELKAESNAPG